jgi:selenocysteine lyase/cysteine desulfurase
MDQHRARLARLLGCDAEEVAITRNTTEGLNIVVNGTDMQPGDEVILTNFDRTYGAVPLRLRAARQGIVLREVSLSIPPTDDEVLDKVAAALSPRTRLILCSHVADGWGFVLPIARLAAIARERGIPLLADGALSFGHLAFDVRQLGCDYFVTSLHKWLSAPFGTGLMYVRRDRIAPLWPLYGARDPQSADIRKFEQIGTRSGPTIAAIGQAIEFHEAVGPERKAARLRYLGTYLLDRLKGDSRIRCITDPNESRRGSLMRIGIAGLKGTQVETALRERFGIFTFGGFDDGFEGIYASPNLFNLPVHLDRFIEALRALAREA